MRISYLLIVFGDTGGSLCLYKFMDKLCERGHEVMAVTPNERIEWKPNFSKTFVERFNPLGNGKSRSLRRMAGKIVSPVRKAAHRFLSRSRTPVEGTADYLASVVQGLLRHWVPSDITVSTFCATSYANYALMDKTVPIYHMQHYEEVFMEDENSLKMARLTYYMPLVLIANSLWLQNQIQNRVGRDSYLLNPGIDTEVFYPRENIADKYNNPSKISIVSYYSPVKFKAWDDAVEAMKIVFKQAPKNKVEWIVFGGRPPVQPDLPITFVGKVFKDSLAHLYSKAHVCFMNSWHESFPLPPLEAMACGTAVVTTRLGTEDYAVDGVNSLVVPPRKPELLAEAILRLVDSPALARELALSGLDTARGFTWDQATDRLEKIFLEAPQRASGKKFADMRDLVAGRKASF